MARKSRPKKAGANAAEVADPKRPAVRRPAGAYAEATPDTWILDALTAGAGRTLDLGSELDLAERVRRGVPTQAVEEAIAVGLLEAQIIYDVVLPRRTLAHRKDNEQPLSPDESDRFARLLRVHARAGEAFGDMDRAARWLRKPNRALNGLLPIDLLNSDAGSRAVEKVLGRIEHGIVS